MIEIDDLHAEMKKLRIEEENLFAAEMDAQAKSDQLNLLWEYRSWLSTKIILSRQYNEGMIEPND
jgi:hypothetical protein